MMQSPSERKGNWMQTYLGKKFWPLDPRAEEVDIRDIAHALSLLCRYGGHCEWHYSVAQHSVYVSHCIEETLALEGLLHDAAEAYCADIIRPIKKHLYEYVVIEARLQAVIGEAFEINCQLFESKPIKDADNAVMLAEKCWVMKQSPEHWEDVGVEMWKGRPACWTPIQAEQAFLTRYDALRLRRAREMCGA